MSFVIMCLAQEYIQLRQSWAQDDQKEQLSSRQRAVLEMEEGKREFAAQHYEAAIASWRRAYELFPDNQLLFYIASTYEKIEDACEEEERAWQAYLRVCEEETCAQKTRALDRKKLFDSRCYLNVEITSNALKSTITLQGGSYALPYKARLLKKSYANIQVRAADHLPILGVLDLKPSVVKGKSGVYPVHYNLTLIPLKTTFEQYQLYISLSVVAAGVGLLSFGAVQLSGAIDLRNKPEYNNPQEGSQEQFDRFQAQYQRDKDQASTASALGIGGIALGVIALGVGGWMLMYRGPNAEIYESIEAEEGLSQEASSRSNWGLILSHDQVGGTWSTSF